MQLAYLLTYYFNLLFLLNIFSSRKLTNWSSAEPLALCLAWHGRTRASLTSGMGGALTDVKETSNVKVKATDTRPRQDQGQHRDHSSKNSTKSVHSQTCTRQSNTLHIKQQYLST